MPLAASALVYTIITAFIGRDVLAQLSTGVANDDGDPLLTAAILSWNATHLPLSEAWWQFPSFHPIRDTLTFSEHLLGVSVVATPLYWLTRDALVAYNLTTLLTFPMCALAMYALVWRVTGSAAGAFVAGLAFGFAPYRISHLPHIQMLTVFWAPLALLGLHAYVETGRLRWLALYGGAWMLQGAANAYTLIFFSVLVGLWVLWFVVAQRRWRALAMISAATAIAFLPLAPIVYTYLTVHARHGFVRSIDEMREYSADVAAVLCAPGNLTFWGWLRVQCGPEGDLFPGVAVMALCVAGLVRVLASRDGSGAQPRRDVLLLRRLLLGVAGIYAAILVTVAFGGPWRIELGVLRVSASSIVKPFIIALGALMGALVLSPGVRASARRSSTVGFYVLAAVITWMLALGPTVTFMGRRLGTTGPFAWLAIFPGADGVRVPARFWLMTVVCLAATAGIVVAETLRGRSRRVTAVAVLAIAFAVLADGWARIAVAPGPLPAPDPRVLAGKTVLEAPTGGTVRDIAAQFRAVAGGWRTINGYSGYAPSHYPALTDALRAEEDSAFVPFRADGELHVIVPRDAPRLKVLVERQPGVVITGESSWAFQYRLPQRPLRRSTRPGGERQTIVNVQSPCSTTLVPLLIDGDEAERWRCDLQDERQAVILDLGRSQMTGTVVHRLGPYYWEFPRNLAIDTSEDGTTWREAWNGSVLAEVIEGGLADPLSLSVVLPFEPRPARYVRLRHQARDSTVGWTIAELEVWSGGG